LDIGKLKEVGLQYQDMIAKDVQKRMYFLIKMKANLTYSNEQGQVKITSIKVIGEKLNLDLFNQIQSLVVKNNSLVEVA